MKAFIEIRYVADYRGAEYPPSPLKLVQAIIASSQDRYIDVLNCLEAQTPVIHAAQVASEYQYGRYVINNDERLEHKNTGTKKTDIVRRFSDNGVHVIYEYNVPTELGPRLASAVASIHTLGRAGDWCLGTVTETLPDGLDGYTPSTGLSAAGGSTVLRVPTAGSVASLFAHYAFPAVPVIWKDVAYVKNGSKALPRALFELTEPVPMQQTVQVAEEIRKAAMAANIPNAHGHDLTAPRLLISPIPTTDWNDNMIRRVIVSSTDAALATSAAQKLAGVPIGAGYLIPAEHDAVFAQFTGISKRWKTVTPVLQSGYHNGDARKKAHVYSKMFEHAGLAQPIRCVETFGDVAFKVSAKHGHDRLPRVHMLIEFGENVTGVVALGTGRFSGLGLFAAL